MFFNLPPHYSRAQIDGLDLWIHTGDYIYEYGGKSRKRGDKYIDPIWEIVSVADYRRRYALYREDLGLQRLHAAAPMMAQWDDHEFMDNPYGNGMGANNHQPTCTGNRTNPTSNCDVGEGDFLTRANRAAQVRPAAPQPSPHLPAHTVLPAPPHPHHHIHFIYFPYICPRTAP